MKRLLTTLILLPLLAACEDVGANYTPILDGPPTPAFRADLTACQNLARDQHQFDQEAAAAVVLGAGAGAILGEIDDDSDAIGGALAGAMVGGTASAVNNVERRESIVIECLRGRGYRVVG